MKSQIVQYDDGVAVRVPRKLAEQLHFAPGDAVDIGVRDGVLTVSAHGHQRHSLAELLEGITPEKLPDESFDEPPGHGTHASPSRRTGQEDRWQPPDSAIHKA